MTNAEIIYRAERIIHNEESRNTFSPEEIGIISAALGIARITLRAQEEAEKNEPLTLDELRGMIGEPVYVVCPNNPCETEWRIVDSVLKVFGGSVEVLFNDDIYEYGNSLNNEWFAYRRKPKEG